jgi:hypothetical protein
MLGLIGEAISLRSFSSLWYWIAVAVFWIAATGRVLGISFASVNRARGGGLALMQLETMTHIAAQIWSAGWQKWQVLWVALAAATLASLSLLAFSYGIELAQALWFLVFPYLMILALQLRLALRILGENISDEALIQVMYRFRIKVQVIGFIFIFPTVGFAFFHLLITGYFR